MPVTNPTIIKVSADVGSATRSDFTFNNAGGVTFGLNNGVITASAPAGVGGGAFTAGISTNGNTAGTTGLVSNQILFVGTNNITLSQSVNGQSASLSFRGPDLTQYLTTARASNDAIGLNTALTANGVSWTVNSSGLSLNVPAFLTTAQPVGAYLTTARASNDAIGLNTALTANGVSWTVNSSGLSLNVPAFLTTAALSNHSHGVSFTSGSVGFQTLSFTNSNGISFNSGTQGIFASHNAITSQTVQTQNMVVVEANGANGTGTFSSGTLDIHAGNNITISTGANAFSIHGAAGGAQTVQTQNMVVLEVNAANGTGTFSSGTVDIHAGNNITLSTGANAFSVYGPSPGAGAAPKRSYWPDVMDDVLITTSPLHTGASGGTGGSTQWTASGRLWSEAIPADIEFNSMRMIHGVSATSAGTGSATWGHIVGIYTLNANSAFSLVSSFVGTMAISQNSVTARTHRAGWGSNSTSNSTQWSGNSSVSFSGTRAFSLHGENATLAAGNYYFAHLFTQRTSSVNVYNVNTVFVQGTAGSSSLGGLYCGFSTTGGPIGWQGIFSTTSNGSAISNLVAPASIHTSAITRSGGQSQWMIPYYLMFRSTT